MDRAGDSLKMPTCDLDKADVFLLSLFSYFNIRKNIKPRKAGVNIKYILIHYIESRGHYNSFGTHDCLEFLTLNSLMENGYKQLHVISCRSITFARLG